MKIIILKMSKNVKVCVQGISQIRYQCHVNLGYLFSLYGHEESSSDLNEFVSLQNSGLFLSNVQVAHQSLRLAHHVLKNSSTSGPDCPLNLFKITWSRLWKSMYLNTSYKNCLRKKILTFSCMPLRIPYNLF